MPKVRSNLAPSSSTKAPSEVDDPDAEKRQRVTAILRNLAQEGHVYALSQLASEAAQDPFAKVKGLIESARRAKNKLEVKII